jgi:hypothetical protein
MAAPGLTSRGAGLSLISLLVPLTVALLMPGLGMAKSASDPPLVFYQRREAETDSASCAWHLLNVETKADRIFHRSDSCTDAIVFHRSDRYAFYLDGQKVMKVLFPIGEMATVTVLATLPRPESTYTEATISPSGHFRVASMVVIDSPQIAAEGQQTYVVYDGKRYERHPTPWGSDALVFVDDLMDREWKSVSARATKCEAGDTPGFRVVSEELQLPDQFIRLSDLLNASTCAGQACASGLPKWDATEELRIAKKLGYQGSLADAGLDGAGYLSIEEGHAGLLFRMTFGDTPHYTPPVYFCNERCQEMVALPALEERPQLSATVIRPPYVLIADEWIGSNAVIYAYRDPAPVMEIDEAVYAVRLDIGYLH